ncbi:uncharacterized protein TRIADDRAFT_60355 [Trichoplax adhaerens]|uniref:Stabilizer of axonemal microtubules 2 n=1 Tax=Trichoplax adhaerens TaxID=10228 RepID=B3S7Z8_TRIAD|nr:hypothetical protein TRIADDRAFT_60355 [Trichoplax adhaerens]EDV21103.1 hypothetical protein TRIADDRAFT_60355 [Trichoplax adhaerens]|eukprot:XP_002116433.1 hypothetical protein TRIADDRAFT_60355 [Trichoplax adhaerens]
MKKKSRYQFSEYSRRYTDHGYHRRQLSKRNDGVLWQNNGSEYQATTNKTDFVHFPPQPKLLPVKIKNELVGQSGEMDLLTQYNQQYLDFIKTGSRPSKLVRAKQTYNFPDIEASSRYRATYSDDFKGWALQPEERLRPRKIENTYKPPQESIDLHTTSRGDFVRHQTAPAATAKPNLLTIRPEEKMNFRTTNKEDFIKYPVEIRQSTDIYKHDKEYRPPDKVTDSLSTNYQVGYKDHGYCKLPSFKKIHSRSKTFPVGDGKEKASTTHLDDFKAWEGEPVRRINPVQAKDKSYSPPTEKMDLSSTMHNDFRNFSSEMESKKIRRPRTRQTPYREKPFTAATTSKEDYCHFDVKEAQRYPCLPDHQRESIFGYGEMDLRTVSRDNYVRHVDAKPSMSAKKPAVVFKSNDPMDMRTMHREDFKKFSSDTFHSSRVALQKSIQDRAIQSVYKDIIAHDHGDDYDDDDFAPRTHHNYEQQAVTVT